MGLSQLARSGPSPVLLALGDSSQIQVHGTWSLTHLEPRAGFGIQILRKLGGCDRNLHGAQPVQPYTEPLEGHWGLVCQTLDLVE